MILPVILILGGHSGGYGILDSVSTYYHTNMRDFFVGILFGTGFFLIAYRGYDITDSIITGICGLSAICLAIIPVPLPGVYEGKIGIFSLSPFVSEYIHFTAAVFFSFSGAINSIFRFTLHGNTLLTKEKRKRNLIYTLCGIYIFLAIAGTSAYHFFFRNTLIETLRPVLFLEIMALEAFGISWFIKGETLCKDLSIKSTLFTEDDECTASVYSAAEDTG